MSGRDSTRMKSNYCRLVVLKLNSAIFVGYPIATAIFRALVHDMVVYKSDFRDGI